MKTSKKVSKKMKAPKFTRNDMISPKRGRSGIECIVQKFDEKNSEYLLKQRGGEGSGEEYSVSQDEAENDWKKIGELMELAGKCFTDLPEDQQEIAKKMGYSGIYADRNSIQEVYDYVMQMNGMERVVALTALGMLQNYLAIHVAKYYELKKKGE